jgi:hypothetical protein
MKNINYITIAGWMVNEEKLNGNELLCYALIYGFSQDGNWCECTHQYIADWLSVSKRTVISLIQSLVEKVVYSQEQLIYTITTNGTKLQQFVSENYMNPNTDKMEYIIGDNSITITEKVFLRKYVNTVYDRGKNGVLSVTDNNHLILKAFATAWKYRELYEQDGGVDNIIRNLHTSPRQFYRYLDIAYMNPDKLNEILSGKLKTNVNDLFQIAKNNQINK